MTSVSQPQPSGGGGLVNVVSCFLNDLLHKPYLWLLIIILIAVVVVAIVIHLHTQRRLVVIEEASHRAVQPDLLLTTAQLQHKTIMKRILFCVRRAEAQHCLLSSELAREIEIDDLVQKGREDEASRLADVARQSPHTPLPASSSAGQPLYAAASWMPDAYSNRSTHDDDDDGEGDDADGDDTIRDHMQYDE